jgi:hypothetical protein
MLTKTKIALAATLVAVTSTVALAQDFDTNLASRRQRSTGDNSFRSTIVAFPAIRATPATARIGRRLPAAAGNHRTQAPADPVSTPG